MIARILLALLALAPLGRTMVAQDDVARPLPLDTHVTVGTLPNGIRYFIRVNGRPEHRAELRLVVNAGSVLEADDERGMAHFVEHMAFNGTRNFERQALVSYLESIGMRFGPDLNAYTSFDETVYMLTVPTDTGRFLETGIAILEDWAHGQLFDSMEVDKERGVVIEEWRLGRGAESRMSDRQLPVLFRGSRYAERLPIGRRQQLQRFSARQLRAFYQRWYRPDLMAVVAVGDFDRVRVETLIREHFSRVAASASVTARPTHPVPDHGETLVAVATDHEATNSRVNVYYKQPLRPLKSVGDYRQRLIERLYATMLNDRFFEVTQKPDAPFIFASNGQGRFVRSGEVYVLGATVPDGGIPRGLEALVTEAQRVARHGFTPGELRRESADLLRALEMANAERDKTNSANYASELTRAYLVDEPVPGIELELALTGRFLPGVTLDEVNRLARAWLTDRNRVILANAPDKTGLVAPTDQALLAVFDTVRGKRIDPYVDAVSDEPLVTRVPAGTRIVAETAFPEVGITEWTLGNGVRVVVKPTDFKNDEIMMTAWSPGGSSLAPDSLYIPALTAALAVSQGGLASFDRVDLQKQLAGKAVSVDPFITPLSEGISGQASPRDLETQLQLVYLYFTAPRRDSAAFLALRQQYAAMLENRSASPMAAFQDTLAVTLAQHHRRAQPISSATFRDMDLDRSLAFYRDRFADASDFTFFFVGNVTPDSLKPLAQRWLGGLPSGGRRETWRDEGIRPPAGVIRREVRRGVEPQARTRIVFTGPVEYTREHRYALRSLAEVLQIRLRERLREDLSGTYGANVGQSMTREPVAGYQLSIDFSSAPERVRELRNEVFRELQMLRDSGATADDIGKVREMQRRSRETSLRQNGFWLNQIEGHYREGLDPREILRYDTIFATLTPQVIRDAARAHVRLDNYVEVTLYPENMPTP